MEAKKNFQRLSICLVKEKYTQASYIINDSNCADPIRLSIPGLEDAALYLKQGNPHPPKWSSLFESFIDQALLGYSASVSAVLLLKLEGRYYVLYSVLLVDSFLRMTFVKIGLVCWLH